MSLSLNFLVQLKILCEKELSKRGQDQYEAGSREVQSVLLNGSTSDSTKAHRVLNCAKKPEKPISVLIPPKEDVKEISEKGKNYHSEKKTYSCAKCDFDTGCHSDFVNHALLCVNAQDIQCSLCSEKCKTAELDHHIKSVHLTPDFFRRGEDGSYNCIKCNKSFKHFSQFKNHLHTLVHRGMDMCKFCKVILPQKELSVHLKELHDKVGDVFVCKICNKELSHRNSLDRHTASVHNGDQKVKCPLCEATFKREDCLKRHLDIHSKPLHPCPLCKRSFKTEESLEKHTKKTHSKNKHKCYLCFEAFSDKSDFDNHVRTHKCLIFRCMVCGEGFNNYESREEHFKIHLAAPKKLETEKQGANNNRHPNYRREFKLPSKADDPKRFEKAMPDSKEDLPALSLSSKNKANLRGKLWEKSVKLKEKGKPVSKVSSVYAGKKCYDDIRVEKDFNLGTCQLGARVSLGIEKCSAVDKSLPSKSTTAMLVGDLVKNDSYGFSTGGSELAVAEQVAVGSNEVTGEFCGCSTKDSNSEKDVNLNRSSCFLHPSSTIPEKTLFIDLNTVQSDSDVESFSSFLPDSSVAESTLVIDIDHDCEMETIDVFELDVNFNPIELQYYEVQTEGLNAVDALKEIEFETDSVVSACRTGSNDFLAHHGKAETDSGVSLCNDASQVKTDHELKELPQKKANKGISSTKAKEIFKINQESSVGK